MLVEILHSNTKTPVYSVNVWQYLLNRKAKNCEPVQSGDCLSFRDLVLLDIYVVLHSQWRNV